MLHTHAFSLIELMVVISIVALLSAVAIPAYKQHMIRVQVTKGIAILDNMVTKAKNDYSTGATSSFTYNGVTMPTNTLVNLNVDPIVTAGYYAPGAGYFDGTMATTMFMFRVCLKGLEGMPGYIAPTTTDFGTQACIFSLIREDNKTFRTFCGAWITGGSESINMDYLPTGCNTLFVKHSD